MNKLTAVVLVLVLGLSVRAADPKLEAEARARAMAPFLDGQTFAVAHVDVSRIDLDQLFSLLKKEAKASDDEIGQMTQQISRAVSAFLNTGCKEIYVGLSLADLPGEPPFVVVPLAENANKEAMAKLVGSGKSLTIGSNLVVAAPETLKRLQNLKPGSRPELARAFAAAGDSVVQVLLLPTADGRKAVEEMLPVLPRTLGGGPTRPITRGIQWAAMGLEVSPRVSIHLHIQAPNAKAATALRESLVAVLKAVSEQKEVRQNFSEFATFVAAMTPTASDNRLTANLDEKLIVSLLVPGIFRAREASAHMVSANNLKQIAIAMHSYYDVYRKFPTHASFDKNGKPLLSWRVHLLPFIEGDNLYKQFHLDEPWDSDHNKKLIAKMPRVYGLPGNTKLAQQGKTIYLAPLGESTMFPGQRALTLPEVTDGTTNTILLVEADDDHAVLWTKPEDLEYAPLDPFKGLGKPWDGTCWAAFVDGSVHTIPSLMDKKTLRGLFTRAGGEKVSPP